MRLPVTLGTPSVDCRHSCSFIVLLVLPLPEPSPGLALAQASVRRPLASRGLRSKVSGLRCPACHREMARAVGGRTGPAGRSAQLQLGGVGLHLASRGQVGRGLLFHGEPRGLGQRSDPRRTSALRRS